jgi:myo-inositol-1(or 4)-monophosphatase
MPHQELLTCAIEAAQAAATIIQHDFKQPLKITATTDHDIKLQTDVDAQNAIERVILSHFPHHQIVGEESNPEKKTDKNASVARWIIDPLDGTVNFSYRIPHFCISIAVEFHTRLVCGVIYDPIRNELFTATQGGGAYLNGEKIEVSSRTQLSDATISIGFSRKPETIQHTIGLYQHYGLRVKKLRAMGAAALDLAYVAAGRLDAYMEQEVSWWDLAAGILLVKEAGGRVQCEPRNHQKFRILADSGHIDFSVR